MSSRRAQEAKVEAEAALAVVLNDAEAAAADVAEAVSLSELERQQKSKCGRRMDSFGPNVLQLIAQKERTL